jgi:hypothetical protein
VISGTYWSAQGTDKDGLKFQAGESYIMPADCVHHAWTGDEETILQLVFTGPAKLVFANPADDPRQASNK